MVGKIFCLMGKSSSGKDTVFTALLEDQSLGLRPVISYTTRPIRHNEQEGREYHFIDEGKLELFRKAGKIIEQRDYHTVKGIWSYCTVDDGQINLQEANYLIITTLEAYQHLKAYFGSDKVVPLYIAVNDAIRLKRALAREERQMSPNYEEVCRRFLADSLDFSGEKLSACGIAKHYYNEDLAACITEIKTDILRQIDRTN